MDGFIEIFTNVWEEGFLGIGITEIIVSLLIFIAGAILPIRDLLSGSPRHTLLGVLL